MHQMFISTIFAFEMRQPGWFVKQEVFLVLSLKRIGSVVKYIQGSEKNTRGIHLQVFLHNQIFIDFLLPMNSPKKYEWCKTGSPDDGDGDGDGDDGEH